MILYWQAQPDELLRFVFPVNRGLRAIEQRYSFLRVPDTETRERSFGESRAIIVNSDTKFSLFFNYGHFDESVFCDLW